MKIIDVITGAALALSIAAHGQTQNKEPLKCGKYQHVEPAHMDCSLSTGTIATCDLFVPERCADDVHVLTEREWQELIARLEKLEKEQSNGK